MSSSPGATPSEATLREHAELLAGGGLLAKSEIEWRAKVLAKAFLSARSETRESEPVAWAVVTSDGDPREANSIHWPATCRHTADGDAKQAAQNWADRHGYSIVPLYAAPQMPAESGVLNQSAVAAPFAASAKAAPTSDFDIEAVSWAYRKLYSFHVHTGKQDSAMMMDRLLAMLAWASPEGPK